MQIVDVLKQNRSFEKALHAFVEGGRYNIYGLGGSQKSFLYATAMSLLPNVGSTLIVVHDKNQKERWERDLRFFLPQIEIMGCPLLEKLTFQASAKSLEIEANHMRALGSLVEGKPCVILVTPEEAAQYVMDPNQVKESMIRVVKGAEINRDDLLEKVVTIGYERVDQVAGRGHISVRGDIVDIFPVNSPVPYRIEFFGDEIDSIRTINLDTQRSIDFVDDFLCMPLHLREGIYESSLFDYAGGIVVIDEPRRIEESLKSYLMEDKMHEEEVMHWRELVTHMEATSIVALTLLQQRSVGIPKMTSIGLTGKPMASFERQVPLLVDELKLGLENHRHMVLILHNEQRRKAILDTLGDHHIPYELSQDWKVTDGVVLIMDGLVTDGFELPHIGLSVITEGTIFGQQKRQLRKKAPKGEEIRYFSDISLGDYVVHAIHGIGKYTGLKTVEIDGIHRDFIEIAYAGTDRLLLPADNLDQLQKYIGNEGGTPRLHKMGGKEWIKTKVKAQKSIDDLADKLVALYAEREIVPGYAFSPDQPWQREFEEQFPYEETDDQLEAVKEIKASMEQPRPMDRLLCGDVGFGKTEVAMRAVFKAVMDSKQVAILVPTTVLSDQHYKNFVDRFEGFGIRIEVINRFRSLKERRTILEDTKAGKVDVLIGTHALLNKKVQFKDLGLLVVDEEQRFGVNQKETWKEWAKSIDVLTLSATPIPRTLHMALVGVREMSVIHTPPVDRLPVQTYVVEYDIDIIKDAIRRELKRGGQVFFLYNKVQSIDHMRDILEEAMPDLRLAVAHGQMTGTMMETIMQDFTEGQYDVLLCTSIIETGLDIPNANTIIIYDADHLGLSQLYQMRGRVGRSHKRAYAYFMYRPEKVLNESAEKRLKAIQEFTELGSGFKLAMRDLEIRGAGNLLGAQQHGNIASVGFAMYSVMLEAAIAKAQHKELPPAPPAPPVLDVEVDAFIDDEYIADGARKINVYQRLLAVNSIAELHEFSDELIDRFGTPTEPVDRLLALAEAKEEAKLLGIKSIVRRGNRMTITWADDSKMANWALGKIDQNLWKRMKITGQKPTVIYYDMQEGNVIRQLKALLAAFALREETV